MIHVEGRIIIRRPLAEVFAYVSDLRHSREWPEALSEVRKTTEGPLGVGARFTFARKFLGRKMEGSNEFTAYEPNALVAFRFGGGPIHGEASYRFEGAPEGSMLTSRITMRTAGLSRLAEPLMAASLRRDMEANLGKLRGILESRTADSRSGS